ncbi:MAG: hypothetical protein ACLQBA_09355 [Candidatus Binataceae bacterium]
MNWLTIFGVMALTGTVIFYALENYGRWALLAFAAMCALASLYGLLQGVWPLCLLEGGLSALALRRWCAPTT